MQSPSTTGPWYRYVPRSALAVATATASNSPRGGLGDRQLAELEPQPQLGGNGPPQIDRHALSSPLGVPHREFLRDHQGLCLRRTAGGRDLVTRQRARRHAAARTDRSGTPPRPLFKRTHVSGASLHVRLKGLAAPEVAHFGEPAESVARRPRFMVELIEDEMVVCDLTQERTHGRRVGWCYRGRQDIAAALIAAGLARDCPRFGGGRYAAAEVPVSRDLPFPGYCRPR